MSEPTDIPVDFAVAIENLSTLAARCDMSPLQLEALYARGYQAWEEGNLDSACDHFALVAQFAPAERRYLFAFACALKQRGEYDHALKLFLHSRNLRDSDPFTAFHIADCLQASGDIEGAREAYSTAIDLCFAGANNHAGYDDLRLRAGKQLSDLNN